MSQLVNSIWKQNMKCVLTRSAESPSNLPLNTPQNLTNDFLPRTILVIHLKINFLKKFNLNLRYILIGALDLDNQDYIQYKASFTKFMDILQSNNLVTTKRGDKL